MISFAAPDVRATLGIDLADWGLISGITRMGVMASFVFLFFADRVGRRAVMMLTVVGFTLANGATALVTDQVQFTVLQLFARLFLTAEYSLAIIMIGEEFPARLRGRSIAVLTSLATVGVMLMAKLQPYILTPRGRGGELAARPGTRNGVGSRRRRSGSRSTAQSWRALYALGPGAAGARAVPAHRDARDAPLRRRARAQGRRTEAHLGRSRARGRAALAAASTAAAPRSSRCSGTRSSS